MEPLGPKIRRHRRRLGLTLDELSGRTHISKPYLSLIETGRVLNPPSDEKLRRLEQALGFARGELLTQAHLERTPKDVRAVLQKLIASEEGSGFRVQGSENTKVAARPERSLLNPEPPTLNPSEDSVASALQKLLERSPGGLQPLSANAIPVINRTSAGYPRDFSDLNYPPRVADEFLSCPDVTDQQAFAVRVQGDSMTPKYHEGDIVVFSPALSPRDGDDCFVRFADGQTTFRRVFFETAEDHQPQIRLQPRNECHRPQIVAVERLVGIHKAVFKYERVEE